MVKIKSFAERQAEAQKAAQEATRRATVSHKTDNRPTALEKIKERLHKLGYQINDEQALKDLIGENDKLQIEQIGLLSEKGIISLNETELEALAMPEININNSAPVPYTEDPLNPTYENTFADSFTSLQQHVAQNEDLHPAPKVSVFSISEALNEPAPTNAIQPQAPTPKPRRITVVVSEDRGEPPAAKPREKLEIASQTTEARIDDLLSRRENSQPQTTPDSKPEAVGEKKNPPRQTVPESATQKSEPKSQEKIASNLESREPNWVKGYPASLQKYCQTSVDKKTGQPKREVKEIRVEKDQNNQPIKVEVEVKPLSPIARKRGDVGATYTIQKHANPEKLDITVKSAEPGKALNYDYFYALVKAARDNGADTIEFNNIRTPEFRDKLLAAALQFKMKLKNPPGAIDLNAQHLDSIPPGCRQYLEKHNEAVKKALQKQGKEIIPPQGQKFGEGPRAEERTHAEKVYIESLREEEKLKRAEKHMREQEKRVNSPSSAEYDQNPARGNRDPSDRRPRENNNRGNYNRQHPRRTSKDR